MELEAMLKERFGFTTFRPGQKEIITNLLAGKSVLGMLPTGTGKSLCYQFTSYLLPGTTVIISPLISLMEDQLTQLQLLGETRAIALNSLLSFEEKEWVLAQLTQYKFIFLSPEMFLTPAVQQALQRLEISLVVVDEAHCVSQWGIDFRPEYLKLAAGIKQIGNPQTLALTATATQMVRSDIKRILFSEQVVTFSDSVDRPNLAFFVFEGAKKEKLLALLPQLTGSGIIYCATRKKVEELYLELKDYYPVAYYHGGLNGQERRALQQQFITGKLRLLIATNAFGMGINKKDIRFVIHYDLPSSPENYLQEVGRAGRDGQLSQAILLYESGDEQIHYFLQQQLTESKVLFELTLKNPDIQVNDPLIEKWEKFFPNRKTEIVQLLERREKSRQVQLTAMLDYIKTTKCRREVLLAYFDEKLQQKPDPCCDNDQAVLQVEEKTAERLESVENWQKIFLKIFKNGKKLFEES